MQPCNGFRQLPKPSCSLVMAFGNSRNLHAALQWLSATPETFMQRCNGLRQLPKPSCSVEMAFGNSRNLLAVLNTPFFITKFYIRFQEAGTIGKEYSSLTLVWPHQNTFEQGPDKNHYHQNS